MAPLVPNTLKSLIASVIVAFVAGTTSSSAHGQADACPSDLDGDGIVAGTDLALVLGSWGPCKACDGDVNGDQLVDGVDLAFVLTRWSGTCAPTVTGITPNAGPLVGGIEVTISGNHLRNPLAVSIGGTPAAVIASSRSAVAVLAPAGAQGSATVLVITQGGAAAPATFTYYGEPEIHSVTPSTGLLPGGMRVTIRGRNFDGVEGITIGGVSASDLQVISTTELSVIVPQGNEGPAVVRVEGPGGSAELTAGFTYLAVPTWATLLESIPDPSIIYDAELRAAIHATRLPWRVRHTATGIEMVLIPQGSFAMGCTVSVYGDCGADESPVHTVTLTRPFYMARFETTQAQWIAVMGSNPSYFQPPCCFGSLSRPVEQVGWPELGTFLANADLRLPTEAEWEYSYRAGTNTAFHGWSSMPQGTNSEVEARTIGWIQGSSPGYTVPVGQKPSNGFGLHDMAGNVHEWVADYYSPSYYSVSPSVDPPGPPQWYDRVVRGGNFGAPARFARASERENYTLSPNSNYYTGFRVARNP